MDRLDAVAGLCTDFRTPSRHPEAALPFAYIVGCLFGKHPLLEHVVECVNCAQLQSLLLMKHLSFAHTKASQTNEKSR